MRGKRRKKSSKIDYFPPGIDVSISFPGFSLSRPLEREKETLENAGHVSPRIWEMTKYNIEGEAAKFSPLLLTCQPLPLCYVLSSPRFWETRYQHFPGSLSLSLAPGDGRESTLGTRLFMFRAEK